MARKPNAFLRIARAALWGEQGGVALVHFAFTGPLVVGLAHNYAGRGFSYMLGLLVRLALTGEA